MPTANPRINITVDKTSFMLLSKIANKKPIATLAKELIFEALETREDSYFSKLADERDEEISPNSLIDHKDAWK